MEPQKNHGEILKQAREAQGIALQTVHEMTKIPMDVLKAIEEGYTVRTLSPFYLKGFVKMYAQHLDVDVTKVIGDYHKEELPPPMAKDEDPSTDLPDFKAFLTKERQQQIVQGLGVFLALFLVSRMVGCIRNLKHSKSDKAAVSTEQQKKEGSASEKKDPKKSSDTAQKKEKKKAAAREVKKPKPTPKPTPKPQPPAASVPAETKKVNLTVKGKKSGWLQVKVDGNVVFQSILKSGVSETWQADKSIELSGKNIQNLEFEMNGKILGGLGRANRSARRVIITKDGLTVKK